MYTINDLTYVIIGAAIEVHRHLGPGLLESAYQACLEYELKKLGLKVESEVSVPLIYKDIQLKQGYRIDLLVEDLVVLELKVVEALTSVHEAQTLSYIKFKNCPVGLLINFNVTMLKDHGIRRVVNNLKEEK